MVRYPLSNNIRVREFFLITTALPVINPFAGWPALAILAKRLRVDSSNGIARGTRCTPLP
jgi:hypothetical protein